MKLSCSTCNASRDRGFVYEGRNYWKVAKMKQGTSKIATFKQTSGFKKERGVSYAYSRREKIPKTHIRCKKSEQHILLKNNGGRSTVTQEKKQCHSTFFDFEARQHYLTNSSASKVKSLRTKRNSLPKNPTSPKLTVCEGSSAQQNEISDPESTSSSGQRPFCTRCLRAGSICCCSAIRSFSSSPRVGILTHPRELRRVQNTGYIAHLCLSNSVFVSGANFTENNTVNAALSNSEYSHYLVYPSEGAINLSDIPPRSLHEEFGDPDKVMFWIVDGTWSTAKKMISDSPNLARLPRVLFTPQSKSIAVRRQPLDFCLGSIEAIHYVLDRFYDAKGAQDSCNQAKGREHDTLLEVFSKMVEFQRVAMAARISKEQKCIEAVRKK